VVVVGVVGVLEPELGEDELGLELLVGSVGVKPLTLLLGDGVTTGSTVVEVRTSAGTGVGVTVLGGVVVATVSGVTGAGLGAATAVLVTFTCLLAAFFETIWSFAVWVGANAKVAAKPLRAKAITMYSASLEVLRDFSFLLFLMIFVFKATSIF
jgi:hypothetical protein